MKSQLTVAGLGGSLAEHSSSLAALKIGLQGAADAGAKTDLLNIRQLSLPMYDPGAEINPPESVRRMCDTIHKSDVLFRVRGLPYLLQSWSSQD
jgi:FMN reductase